MLFLRERGGHNQSGAAQDFSGLNLALSPDSSKLHLAISSQTYCLLCSAQSFPVIENLGQFTHTAHPRVKNTDAALFKSP